VGRRQIAIVQDVDIVEQSYSPFLKLDVMPFEKVRLVAGAGATSSAIGCTRRRHDRQRPQRPRHAGAAQRQASLTLGPWVNTEFLANFGTGFHSNDARAVIAAPTLDALPTAPATNSG